MPNETIRRGPRARTLGWGLAASILLVVLSALFSIREVNRTRSELVELYSASQRTTYLIAHVTQELSLTRLTIREALSEAPETSRQILERIKTLDTSLQTALDELGAELDETEARLWNQQLPRIEKIRAHLHAAAAAASVGSADQADILLDAVGLEASVVIESLAALGRLDQERLERARADWDDHLRSLRAVELGISLVLLVGISLVWLLVIRSMHRNNAELDGYVRRLEVANADLDAFAGRVAHDIKNAISPFALAVSVLRRAPEDAQRVSSAAERLERATSRVGALVDALLAFARSGFQASNSEWCLLEVEVRGAVEELTPHAERAGVTITVRNEAPAATAVRCSSGLLQVVLQNVLGNAVKFSDGQVERSVCVRLCTVGGFAQVTVEDTGPGIPQEALVRLFVPFYRVPGTRAPGTGIGLATVKRIVDAHGGEVSVSSKVGRGSAFVVRLPLANPNAADKVLPQKLDAAS